MRHGKLPYRDFFVEYPPGALPAFALPAVLPGASFTFWSKALQWLLAASCIVFAAATLRTSRWRAALIGLTPALLGQVTFTRFDFWPAAPAAAAGRVARRIRPARPPPARRVHATRRIDVRIAEPLRRGCLCARRPDDRARAGGYRRGVGRLRAQPA